MHRFVEYLNNKLKYTQSGIIQNYLMAGVLGIVSNSAAVSTNIKIWSK